MWSSKYIVRDSKVGDPIFEILTTGTDYKETCTCKFMGVFLAVFSPGLKEGSIVFQREGTVCRMGNTLGSEGGTFHFNYTFSATLVLYRARYKINYTTQNNKTTV